MSAEHSTGITTVDGHEESKISGDVISWEIGRIVIRGDGPIDGGFGYDFSNNEQVVLMPTVPYAGTEPRYTTHIRQPINEFMLTKPA